MTNKSIYQEGHLFVASIRILEHQNGSPPNLDKIAKMMNITSEQAGLISRRLQENDIIEEVEGAFGERWAVLDHLQLEALPRESANNELDNALKKFQSERQKLTQQVESIKEQQAQKRKELFAGIEKKLKKDLSKD